MGGHQLVLAERPLNGTVQTNLKAPAIDQNEEMVMSKKILVVDDDPDVRLFNKTVVEESGYQALEAADGDEGLKLIKTERPDLVILDVMMPKQTGLRLYRELKTNRVYKDTAVIMLSGVSPKAFARSQKALTEFGGKKVPDPDIYLEKPVDAKKLSQAIELMLK
jgi:twitching motility two-component system response regulator PilH